MAYSRCNAAKVSTGDSWLLLLLVPALPLLLLLLLLSTRASAAAGSSTHAADRSTRLHGEGAWAE